MSQFEPLLLQIHCKAACQLPVKLEHRLSIGLFAKDVDLICILLQRCLMLRSFNNMARVSEPPADAVRL
jgi:hypothetical protein